MSEEKNSKQKKKEKSKNKKHITPADIEGKIDIPDKRERRDGPGGN